MTFGSVCSGIEAASVAWGSLGWTAAWLSEIEKFPCAVLAHRFPDVRNVGDMRAVAGLVLAGEIEAPDVFTGGTPCQAFSVAGMRRGLEDGRGALSMEFCRIADAVDDVRRAGGKPPCVVIWENVPGVLSDAGNAFGCFLAALAGEDDPLVAPGGRWSNAGCVLGPARAIAWRILDAQYFGLAQRRRRVFVVASARNGIDPAAILFEFDGVRRDTAPSREAREVASSPAGGGPDGGLIAGAVSSKWAKGSGGPAGDECYNMVAQPVRDCIGTLTSAGGKAVPGNTVQDAEAGQLIPVAFHGSQDPDVSGDCTHPVGRNQGQETCIQQGMAVRRLTPRECERLQGFPDDWTAIPWRGKPASDCPDGPRYKAIGNSWAVPVARWVGRRVQEALA